MSNASAIPAAIDALLAVARTAIDSHHVIDGPGATPVDGTSYLYIGVTDGDDGETTAAQSTQAWAWLGHTQRDEELDIFCDARAWTGDQANMKGPRDAVFATLKAFTDAIESDPSLDGSVIYATGVTSTALRQWQDSKGVAAALAFTVSCRARLGA